MLRYCVVHPNSKRRKLHVLRNPNVKFSYKVMYDINISVLKEWELNFLVQNLPTSVIETVK